MLAKRDVYGREETVAEHMRKTADIASIQYDNLPQGVKNLLPSRELCIFVAAAHDLGKASPTFQAHINGKGRNEPPHWLISYGILRNNGFDKSICEVVASHHGRPPDNRALNKIDQGAFDEECGFYSPVYQKSQSDLLEYALVLSNIDSSEYSTKLSKTQQMLLAGFVIICDWQASSDEKPEFPEPPIFMEPDYETFFIDRFAYKPRPVQSAVIDIFKEVNKPGLLIIEAPMGEGKTEAALAAAELMAIRSQRSGLFFALPTQATSNAMFSRVNEWVGALGFGEPRTIDLLHGKNYANPEYRELAIYGDEENNTFVHNWLKGRKSAFFADFLIGTIDHLLMMALKQKHVMLKHLALSGKVIVIDECHAYDAYMDAYLARVLNWLGEYSVPVIILSATLTSRKRRELINAYLGKENQVDEYGEPLSPYPLITYLDNGEIYEVPVHGVKRSIEVEIKRIKDEEIKEIIAEKLLDGGCLGIIANTVKRAQELYEMLKAGGENVILLHSRFKAADRARKEQQLINILGKDGIRENRLIIVGTQVLEQSLDIDFDMLITDLCPMDLLIQRIGRLHRHLRSRPKRLATPICYVTEHEESQVIYGEYLLERTRQLLPAKIKLPDDIAFLVNAAYDGSDVKGIAEYKFKIEDKKRRAEVFQLEEPDGGHPSITGLLRQAVNDSAKDAEMSVRDGEDALEVIIIDEAERNQGIQLTEIEMLERSVKLPFFFKADAINELEKNYRDNYKNLYLVLDKDGRAELCGYSLKYSEEKGLEYEKIQSS